jgi:hypothetical protein
MAVPYLCTMPTIALIGKSRKTSFWESVLRMCFELSASGTEARRFTAWANLLKFTSSITTKFRVEAG